MYILEYDFPGIPKEKFPVIWQLQIAIILVVFWKNSGNRPDLDEKRKLMNGSRPDAQRKSVRGKRPLFWGAPLQEASTPCFPV